MASLGGRPWGKGVKGPVVVAVVVLAVAVWKGVTSFPDIPREEVVLGERLGSGASGEVFAGVYRGRDVAVKVFKADIGPDGNARDELDVALTVDHPNLTKSLGVVHASSIKPSGGSISRSESEVAAAAGGVPEGAGGGGGVGGGDEIENLRWLVMERVVGRPLAEKPDFSSVLRCRWGSGRRFEPVLVLAVLLQVARAMSYLHEKAICHGDLYAHNVLVDGETGAAVLCDFGASFFYPTDRQHDCSMLEGTEVRAFGLMSRDMACRSAGCEWILQDLVPSCLQSDASHRPSFHEIINQLHAELMQSVEPSSPMVTSAKSLHSLLDRPDIAAERVRVLSQERRQDPSSSSFSRGGDAKSLSRGGGDARNGSSYSSSSGGGGGGVSTNTSTVDSIGGGGTAEGGGVAGYPRGGAGGRGGGGGARGRPLVSLGEVMEGTADDEGEDNDNEEGEGEGEKETSLPPGEKEASVAVGAVGQGAPATGKVQLVSAK
ncbi:unnamed protein product [Ectocarpus sp. CCAP 1310/34]|nr:unnamed protein product [Ectocarpus sp. CCAP 1310/34]